MDNGPLQRQQASKIKHTVSQTSRSKRRRWTVNSDTLSFECESSQTFSYVAPTDGALDGLAVDPTKNAISTGNGLIDAPCLDESMWNNLFDNYSFASQPHLSLDGYTEFSMTSQSVESKQPSLSAGSTEDIFDSSPDSLELHQTECMWLDNEVRNDHATINETSWTSEPNKEECSMSATKPTADYTLCALSHSHKFPSSGSISEQQTGASAGPHPWASGEEAEDMLFMHYLDHVFYIQYPFYDALDKQSRGWLLSILKGVRSAYHASLALSEHHLLSTQSRHFDIATSRMKLRSKDSYYDLAHREMERSVEGSIWWDGSIRLVRSLECLASILQLLFLEVIRVFPLSIPMR